MKNKKQQKQPEDTGPAQIVHMRAGSIRFDYLNKSFLYDAGDIVLREGDHVVVETEFGMDIGVLDNLIREMDVDIRRQPVKRMVRPATPDDIKQMEAMRAKEEQALKICEEEVDKAGLGMKLVSVRYSFDGSKVTFCYTADGRVDFRELVRELASRLRTRIELRQVGVRDEARLFGGVGPCGRSLCCAIFLKEFHPVSIRMAKEQGLPLNPLKISGICGRLFCCLKYEFDTYTELRRCLPRAGDNFEEGEIKGRILSVNVLKNELTILQGDGNRVNVKVELCERPRRGESCCATRAQDAEAEGAEEATEIAEVAEVAETQKVEQPEETLPPAEE